MSGSGSAQMKSGAAAADASARENALQYLPYSYQSYGCCWRMCSVEGGSRELVGQRTPQCDCCADADPGNDWTIASASATNRLWR